MNILHKFNEEYVYNQLKAKEFKKVLSSMEKKELIELVEFMADSMYIKGYDLSEMHTRGKVVNDYGHREFIPLGKRLTIWFEHLDPKR